MVKRLSLLGLLTMLLPGVGGLGILPERSSGAAGRRKRSGETPKPLKQSKMSIASGGIRFAAAAEPAPVKPKRATRERVPRPKVKNLYGVNDVFHLWHPRGGRPSSPNRAYYETRRPARCEVGLVR